MLRFRPRILYYAKLPLRRVLTEGWFVPAIRVGATGNPEYLHDGNIITIEPKGDGELFAYVNDAVVGLPWIWNWLYEDNRGRSSLGISVVPQRAVVVRVLSLEALSTIINEIGSQFELTPKNRLVTQFDTPQGFKQRIELGKSFDIVITTDNDVDELITSGRVDADGSSVVAHSDMVVTVRTGMQKPDISTIEAFKHVLQNAKSVAYSKENCIASELKEMFDQLGIGEEMKSKTIVRDDGIQVASAVADGSAELGPATAHDVAVVRGAEVAGAFPPELQMSDVFTAGIVAAAAEPDAAKALMTFLETPAVAQLLKARHPATPARNDPIPAEVECKDLIGVYITQLQFSLQSLRLFRFFLAIAQAGGRRRGA